MSIRDFIDFLADVLEELAGMMEGMSANLNRMSLHSLKNRVAMLMRRQSKHGSEVPHSVPSAPPSTSLIYWAYLLVPATTLDDALASLEEVYPRILARCGGKEQKASKIYKSNIVMIVAGYHKNRLLKLGGLCMAYLGFGKLWQVLKGFIS